MEWSVGIAFLGVLIAVGVFRQIRPRKQALSGGGFFDWDRSARVASGYLWEMRRTEKGAYVLSEGANYVSRMGAHYIELSPRAAFEYLITHKARRPAKKVAGSHYEAWSSEGLR